MTGKITEKETSSIASKLGIHCLQKRWKIKTLGATHAVGLKVEPLLTAALLAPIAAMTDGRENVGIDRFGMAGADLPLAACGGGDRLDRKLVLFHSSRPQPEAIG
jgi:hypothetical protein